MSRPSSEVAHLARALKGPPGGPVPHGFSLRTCDPGIRGTALGLSVCQHAVVRDRGRLPWLLSLPLILGGSFTAHAVGSHLFVRRAASVDADGGRELI